MLIRKPVFGTLAGVVLLLSTVGTGAAQMPSEMPSHASQKPNSFHQIDQPLWITGSVTLAGLALIGLEVWWFLLSKPRSRRTAANPDVQEMTITVDGGYEPNQIR